MPPTIRTPEQKARIAAYEKVRRAAWRKGRPVAAEELLTVVQKTCPPNHISLIGLFYNVVEDWLDERHLRAATANSEVVAMACAVQTRLLHMATTHSPVLCERAMHWLTTYVKPRTRLFWLQNHTTWSGAVGNDSVAEDRAHGIWYYRTLRCACSEEITVRWMHAGMFKSPEFSMFLDTESAIHTNKANPPIVQEIAAVVACGPEEFVFDRSIRITEETAGYKMRKTPAHAVGAKDALVSFAKLLTRATVQRLVAHNASEDWRVLRMEYCKIRGGLDPSMAIPDHPPKMVCTVIVANCIMAAQRRQDNTHPPISSLASSLAATGNADLETLTNVWVNGPIGAQGFKQAHRALPDVRALQNLYNLLIRIAGPKGIEFLDSIGSPGVVATAGCHVCGGNHFAQHCTAPPRILPS